VITEHTDDELDRLLRAHYHSEIDGIEAPDRLVHAVLATTGSQRARHGGWASLLAFTLAGASFVIILASSRAVEILLNL
jgi:hypothetical protein